MTTLATVEDVKHFLDETTADHDGLLQIITEGVSARILREIGEDPEAVTVTEHVVSRGETELPVERYIDEIASIVEGVTTLTTSDYRKKGERTVERLSNGLIAPWVKGEVAITYRPGWTTPPADLREACMVQAAFEFKNSDTGGNRLGLASKSPSGAASGESTAYVPLGWLPMVQRVIENRRPL